MRCVRRHQYDLEHRARSFVEGAPRRYHRVGIERRATVHLHDVALRAHERDGKRAGVLNVDALVGGGSLLVAHS
ncbi:hypothetical protein [uncultured Duncaniella sp.]|uniref:hypothetical protein n=1 Tax=uncultured Duncaniella sp. TaxID=2768039 RepID=UPI0025A9EE20|nr:hypothetical protein [uncultured Duncaniella sp.]